jgi:hypothetical protein
MERNGGSGVKIDYNLIARLLGLNQYQEGDTIALSDVRQPLSLDTGSLPQIEGLMEMFSKHKIEDSQQNNSVLGNAGTTTGSNLIQTLSNLNLGDAIRNALNGGSGSGSSLLSIPVQSNPTPLASAITVVTPANSANTGAKIPIPSESLFAQSTNFLRKNLWFGFFHSNLTHQISTHKKSLLVNLKRNNRIIRRKK